MRKITKIVLKLFIAYFVFCHVLIDHTKMIKGYDTDKYFFQHTVPMFAIRPFYYRSEKTCEDYYPYIGPHKYAKLKHTRFMARLLWPVARVDSKWYGPKERPWEKFYNNLIPDEIYQTIGYCSGYLADNKYPIPDYKDEFGISELNNTIMMPSLEILPFTGSYRNRWGDYSRGAFLFGYFEETYFVNSLEPLIVVIAPVNAVNECLKERKTETSYSLGNLYIGQTHRQFILDNRIPTHSDLKWFSPDMDVLPQPLEKISDNEQRIKVPWGWLVYKKETATRTMAESVCKEGEDKTYTVDYWKVYAEEKDYYDDF
jgi:hypothetical protein